MNLVQPPPEVKIAMKPNQPSSRMGSPTEALWSTLEWLRQRQSEVRLKNEWIPIEELCQAACDGESSAFSKLTEDEWLELILAEYDLRKQIGESPTLDEYAGRFPHLQKRLQVLFALVHAVDVDEGNVEDAHATIASDGFVRHQIHAQDTPETGDAHTVAASVTVAAANKADAASFECGMKIGKYRLEEKLGQGGMGTVFRASHSLINHHVAIKLMLPHLIQRPELKQRFLKEAQVCVGLQHPHLVRTFDIDEDLGCLYLTMELLSGSHLAHRVAKEGPLPPDQVAQILRQAAEGLAYAHAQGIIHRDIKPHNVMLTSDGHVKVLDLGLAKLLDEFSQTVDAGTNASDSQRWNLALERADPSLITSDGRLTSFGSVLGTIGYMSREQVMYPAKADARNDVFSLGCTAYFLLTGQSVFGKLSPMQVLQLQVSRDNWPSLALDSLDERWQPVLRRLLAWNANKRYQSMTEVVQALDSAFGQFRSWKPDPDDVEQLRRKLSQFGLVSDDEWIVASLPPATAHTLSTFGPMTSRRGPTAALQQLLEMPNHVSPVSGESILTKYQVQQIIAGHAELLKQGQYTVRDSINRGWKGELFLVRNGELERPEVMRVLPLNRLIGLGNCESLTSELQDSSAKLLALNSFFVAKWYAFQVKQDYVRLHGEYVPGRTLRDEVTSRHDKEADPSHEILRTAMQLTMGVRVLHATDSLHLDLCPERWVRRESGEWCLLDPGIAPWLIAKDWSRLTASTGLPPVLAQELLHEPERVGPATDVFALGHVFRFLLTKQFPFKSITIADAARPWLPKSVDGLASLAMSEHDALPRASRWASARPDRQRNWRTEFQGLINQMTEEDLGKRLPTIDQVLHQLNQIGTCFEPAVSTACYESKLTFGAEKNAPSGNWLTRKFKK